MMRKKQSLFYIAFLMGAVQFLFLYQGGLLNNISGICSYLAIFLTIQLYFLYFDKEDFESYKLMMIYLYIGLVAIVRGFFEAQNYWDWKFFVFDTFLIMLVPFVSFLGSNKNFYQAIYFYFIKYLIPFSFVVLLVSKDSVNSDGYNRFLSPIYLLIIFFPILSGRWKLIIAFVVFLMVYNSVLSRSTLIRTSVATALMLGYYFRHFITQSILKTIHLALFVVPIVLFTLGVTGVFNIFSLGENYSGQYVVKNSDNDDEDLTTDTRTFIYQEVISSGIVRNSWLFGESASGGYISRWFESDVLCSKGRARSEVGILNQFNYVGIVGVLFFSLIYYFASNLCINKSNNYICKLVGIFIAFRWMYSWIEDIPDFSMNYFFLWLTIGLCFSKSFREMDDDEMKSWILGMFDKKYIEDTSIIY